jgi:rhamnose transport system permease protein
VNFGLGLLNIPGIVMSIIVGALLITVVAIPAIAERWPRATRNAT